MIKRAGGIPINYKEQDFAENKYDVIVDVVGADYFNRNIDALNKGGRLALIGFISGAKAQANLGPILVKHLSVFGSTTSGLDEKKKAKLMKDIEPYFEKIKPFKDKVFGFDGVPEALQYMKEYKNAGKVVVRV